jgi:CheY-like chemotaxis protein
MFHALSILAIDDFPAMREMLLAFLEGAGHHVICADDGKMGLQILARQPVDLVVTDILMPEKDGLEFIREVRQGYPTLPIVAISGGGTVMAGEYCLTAAKSFGATATLRKPFSRQQLFVALDAAMGDRAAVS